MCMQQVFINSATNFFNLTPELLQRSFSWQKTIVILLNVLTSPDVSESLSLALHPYTLPAVCSVQVEGGDERQSDGGQVLLHTAAGHPDQRGQRVLTDGVINAVCQHIAWRREQESVHSPRFIINPFHRSVSDWPLTLMNVSGWEFGTTDSSSILPTRINCVPAVDGNRAIKLKFIAT